MMQKLDVELKDEEVKQALYDMDPWKSLGSDGYPVGFYQKSWNIVGSKVCTHVRRLWDNPKEIAEVNYINLCLIPKVQTPQPVSHFRPISLYNTIYKLLNQIIVNRPKIVMDDLISHFKTGFIYKRSINENIVVANEMFPSINRLQGLKKVIFLSKYT